MTKLFPGASRAILLSLACALGATAAHAATYWSGAVQIHYLTPNGTTQWVTVTKGSLSECSQALAVWINNQSANYVVFKTDACKPYSTDTAERPR